MADGYLRLEQNNKPAARPVETDDASMTGPCTFFDAMASQQRNFTPFNFSKARVGQFSPASPEPGTQPQSACDNGFEMSKACITERGLDDKVAAFQRHLDAAQPKLGTSYKVDLRVVNNRNWGPYGTPTDSDVWTEMVRDKDMHPASYTVNVTADFLQKQPDILFESSSTHEVCHIKNDDLPGFNRQGSNVEIAEERCVANAVGFPRYEQYLQAYFKYKPNSFPKYDYVLQRVKDVELVPPPVEQDDADKRAAEFFKTHADGKEHLLVDNGQIHDITSFSDRNGTKHDQAKLDAVIAEQKPMVFFHNHPPEDGRAAMFPSHDDYGVAGLYSFLVYRQNPNIPLEFRVMQLGQDRISDVSYGFKKPVIDEIKQNAQKYRDVVARGEDPALVMVNQGVLDTHLKDESYRELLQYGCSIETMRLGLNACKTDPIYFQRPSDRFILHARPQS